MTDVGLVVGRSQRSFGPFGTGAALGWRCPDAREGLVVQASPVTRPGRFLEAQALLTAGSLTTGVAADDGCGEVAVGVDEVAVAPQ